MHPPHRNDASNTVVMRAIATHSIGGFVITRKRAFDFAVAGVVFLLTLPVQLVVAALVRVKMGGPVLFRQERIGQYGQRFTLVKFRSMRAPDPASARNGDADRLTPFGLFLRSSSLDELPTLWNVLRGHMSLVGPRPLLPSYLDRYTLEQARRHDVRPGITGWAQINGRNALGWEARFRLDAWYVEHRSFLLDLRILGATVWRVLDRSGVSADGHVTMPEFEGGQADARAVLDFRVRPQVTQVRRVGKDALNGRPGVALYRAGDGLVRRLTSSGRAGLR